MVRMNTIFYEHEYPVDHAESEINVHEENAPLCHGMSFLHVHGAWLLRVFLSGF